MRKTPYFILGLLVLAIASLILIKSMRPRHPSPISLPSVTPAPRETPPSLAMTPRAIETTQRISVPPPEVSPIETIWPYDIIGKVVDIRNSSPVADAEVSLFYTKYILGEEPEREFITTTTTDYNGEFFIAHPDIKKYSVLIVTKPGWATIERPIYSRSLAGRFPLILYTAPEESIQGIAVDKNNQPLAGVRIEKPRPMEFEEPYGFRHLSARAVTDEDGRFALSGLLPGTYQFLAIKEGFAFREVKNIPTGTKDLVIQLQLGTCSIQGRVETFETAEPVSQAKVALRRMGHNVLKTITDANGEFGFEGLAPGRYEVTVADPLAQRLLGGETLTLDERQEVTQVVIKCKARLTVSGRIVDDETGKPITDCRISYYGVELNWKKVDSEGRFVLPNTWSQPGSVGLVIKAKGYIDRQSYGDYFRFWKYIKDVKELENLEIRLKRAHQARGVVLSPSDDPLPDVLLEYQLRREKSSDRGGELKTNAQGEFTFFCLPSLWLTWDLIITACHPQFGLVESTFKRDEWGSDTIKIRFPAPSSIIVSVKDEENAQPVSGAKIVLRHFAKPRHYNKLFVTDHQGMATIGPLAPERYKLTVSALGRAPRFIDEISLAQGEVKELEVLIAGGKALRGRVEDKQGEPIAEARVQVRCDNVTIASAVSNEDGEFSLTGLPPDKTSHLGVYANGFISYSHRLESEQLDSDSPFVVVLLRKPLIKGQVISALDGQPIEDYKLNVYFDPSYANRHFHEIERPEVSKFPGGYFELALSQSGNFWIQATSPAGFSGELFDVSVKPDSQVEDVVLEMYPNASISGVVVNAVDRTPLADTSLSLEFQRFYICTAVSVFNQYGKSGPDGEFSLPQVARGKYNMKISHPKFASEGREIEVQPGEEINNFVIELGGGATIDGSVIDSATRKPLRGIKVSIRSEYMSKYGGPRSFPRTATTDEHGDFLVQKLPYGKCGFSVKEPGYLEWWRSLELSRDKPRVDLLIELQKENILAGYVYDELEQPINEARLSLSFTQRSSKWATTDAQGYFKFDKMPALSSGEEATLLCQARGFERKKIALTELNKTDLRITLEHAPTIQGRVVYSDSNEPATSYRIVALRYSNRDQDYVLPERAENVQNKNGEFKLTNLRPGEYMLAVNSDEYYGQVRDLKLQQKQILTDVVISISTAALLRGSVLSASSRLPIAQAEVYVGLSRNAKRSHLQHAVTDDEGTFSFTGLPENSRLYIKVLHPDYALGFGEVTLPWQEDLTIRLENGTELHVQVLREDTGEPWSDCRTRIYCHAIEYYQFIDEPQNKEKAEFVFEKVPPQTYELRAIYKDNNRTRIARQEIKISPDDEVKFVSITIPFSQL